MKVRNDGSLFLSENSRRRRVFILILVTASALAIILFISYKLSNILFNNELRIPVMGFYRVRLTDTYGDFKVNASGSIFARHNAANSRIVMTYDSINKRMPLRYPITDPNIPEPVYDTVQNINTRLENIGEVLAKDFEFQYAKDTGLIFCIKPDVSLTKEQVEDMMQYCYKLIYSYVVPDSCRIAVDVVIKYSSGDSSIIAYKHNPPSGEKLKKIGQEYRNFSFEKKLEDWRTHTYLSLSPQFFKSGNDQILCFPLVSTNPYGSIMGISKNLAINEFFEQFLLDEGSELPGFLEIHLIGPDAPCLREITKVNSYDRGQLFTEFVILKTWDPNRCYLHPEPRWIKPKNRQGPIKLFPF